MSWAEYFRCANGHIGLRPPITFVLNDEVITVCSQECRNSVEGAAKPEPPKDKFGRCLDCKLKDYHAEGCSYFVAHREGK